MSKWHPDRSVPLAATREPEDVGEDGSEPLSAAYGTRGAGGECADVNFRLETGDPSAVLTLFDAMSESHTEPDTGKCQ